MKRSIASKRGTVLVMVVASMGLLLLLGVAFARLVSLEARAASNWRDAYQARLAAEAGLEHAVFRLTRTELDDPVTSFHGPWTYRSQDGRSLGIGTPLGSARNPSFCAGYVQGYAYSGGIGGSYQANGDHFVLEVRDANSKLALNSRQPNLAQTLEVLGAAIEEYDDSRLNHPNSPFFDPELHELRAEALRNLYYADQEVTRLAKPCNPLRGPDDTNLARIMLRERARQGGIADLQQLLGEPGQGLSRWQLALLRDYVTVEAWLDDSMVSFPGQRGERPRQETGQTKPCPRAPVNLNTAPWPVLVACLTDLAATDDKASVAVSYDLAKKLATTIVLRRRGDLRNGIVGRPFRTWEGFYDWIDAEVEAGVLSSFQAAIIKANANPNWREAERLSAAVGDPGLSKRDLDYSTTEFSFISYGIYEINSLGRVLGPGAGPPLAERTLRARVRIYDVWRALTQADFEAVRDEKDQELTASFPNPVRALTGDTTFPSAPNKNFRGDAGEFRPAWSEDPNGFERRRLVRVQASSTTTGYVQLITNEAPIPEREEVPEVAGAPRGVIPAHTVVHHYPFGANLHGELWHFNPKIWCRGCDWAFSESGVAAQVFGGAATLASHDRSSYSAKNAYHDLNHLVSGLGEHGQLGSAEDFYARAIDELREKGLRVRGRLVYTEDITPNGLRVHPRRKHDVRYRYHVSDGYTHPTGDWTVQDRGALSLWFMFDGERAKAEGWTPILEAWGLSSGTRVQIIGAKESSDCRPETGRLFQPKILADRAREGLDGQRPPDAVLQLMQVEARLEPNGRLRLRARRWTTTPEGQLWAPRLWDDRDHQPYLKRKWQARLRREPPPTEAEWEQHRREKEAERIRSARDAQVLEHGDDWNASLYELEATFAGGAANTGEWHQLYIPFWANVFNLLVDGEAANTLEVRTEREGPSSWKRPDQDGTWRRRGGDPWVIHTNAADRVEAVFMRVAPGGFRLESAPRRSFRSVLIDDMVTTNAQASLFPPNPAEAEPGTSLRPEFIYARGELYEALLPEPQRYPLVEGTRAGTFTGAFPPFQSDKVRVGRLLWTEHMPRGWGRDPAGFSNGFKSQAVYRGSLGNVRTCTSGALPNEQGAGQSGFEAGWAQLVERERRLYLQQIVQHYERLVSAKSNDSDPSRETFAHYLALFEQELAATSAQIEGLKPTGVSGGEGAQTSFLAASEDLRVRFELKFLQSTGGQRGVSCVSPVLDDLILPYQEQPRLLWRRWSDE